MGHAVFRCSRCGKRAMSVRNLNAEAHLVFTALTSADARLLGAMRVEEAEAIVRVEKCGTWVRESK